MTKSAYRELCQQEASIPLFSQAWWLDAVCGEEGWDVAIVEKGGGIAGALPFVSRKKMGLTLLSQPPLTQTLGPWVRPSGAKYAKALGYQKDVMEGLIEKLPTFDKYSQNWHHSVTNWLPFYWRGFKQTTRYTYILSNLKDKEGLWADLNENVRTDIKKASNRFKLKIRNDLTWQGFYEINQKTFERQRMNNPHPPELLERVDRACFERRCRKIWIAEDAQGNRHAGVYIIWDQNSAYYLMGGSDPEYRNSGATSLLIWEAIQQMAAVTNTFDFEGSMIEGVERFFRNFGAHQTPYFCVSKTPSKLLKLRSCLQGIFGNRV